MHSRNIDSSKKKYFVAISTIGLLFFIFGSALQAKTSSVRERVTVKEYERVFTTYPYSDPDPVPTMSRIYPYFKYDGFTDKPVQKKWKVVELSNRYIRVLIMPQIGGKIWTAIEKSTGRPFIYFNHVVKFRDISERGPWTSGGIEPNFGIFGHTPDCFSPVDYRIRTDPDGSASCIIGALDLLTRSTWRIEIKLRPGRAYFTTRTIWHNGSGMEEPYYSWMNAAVKASGNLQFVFPGTNWIFHTGTVHPWPIDTANGHNISWYDQNNFGGAKSYHVLGRFSQFYGAYWHDDNFGMAHYAAYGDKVGRKIWIWGLSQQGMIWQKLLTDTDGQYVELQSGRLYNQAEPQSTYTPFKHKGFAPFATDTWKEYWMPIKGIGGFVTASPWGAMNVTQQGKQLIVGISPVQRFRGRLQVFDGNLLLSSREVNLKTMQPASEVFRLNSLPEKLRVCLGGDKLVYAAGDEDSLTRPLTSPANFDWNSTYGLYVRGKELERRRHYVKAESDFQKCLAKNPNYLPALDDMASLANRRADFTAAYDFARRALSIDTYDPGANYQFGIASAGLGHDADAKAAFSIASISIGWRSAAWTQLAEEYLREKEYDKALAYARKSLDYNRFNLTGLRLEACVDRLTGDTSGAVAVLKILRAYDPLSHFVQFEKYLMGKAGSHEFAGMIRSNLAYETYLELACWYHDVGLNKDALKVLALAPQQTEVLYWQAYLRHDSTMLARANAASPEFVFPFRWESIPVYEWAIKHSDAWQPKYYLALLRWSNGEINQARQLFADCGDRPEFAPFYAARAEAIQTGTTRDLERAARLDPGEWRYGAMLIQYYLNHMDPSKADSIATEYAKRFPDNNALIRLRSETLIATGQYQAAANLLMASTLLPAEGATQGHVLYREAFLMLAVQRMKAGSFRDALKLIAKAREWPENLGVGEPYPKEIDDRLENWLTYECYRGLGMEKEAQRTLNVLALQLWPEAGDLTNAKMRPLPDSGAGAIVRALALKRYGRADEGRTLLMDWMKRDPASAIAQWGYAVFEGRSVILPKDAQFSGCAILAAWLQKGK